MADENKTERVQLLMTPSEVKAIDDWSFENRIRGRAEAMRRLCQIALFIDSGKDSYFQLIRSRNDGRAVNADDFAVLAGRLIGGLTMLKVGKTDEEDGVVSFKDMQAFVNSWNSRDDLQKVADAFRQMADLAKERADKIESEK